MPLYAGHAESTPDPRRAHRLAARLADPGPITTNAIPPGVVQQDHASINQLLASQVNFDRAGFAYDATNHQNYTVNSIGNNPGWTKVASNADNLRLSLGDLSDPVYVWVWATFGWALDPSTVSADHGHFVAVLYDDLDTAAHALCSAGNVASDIVPKDGWYHEKTYLGFFGIDPNDPALTSDNPNYTGKGEWNIGMQHRYTAGQKVGVTSCNRQSIIAFLTSFPPGGASHYTLDSTLY